MSDTVTPRNKRLLIALLALAVAAVAVFAAWRLTSGDDDKATDEPTSSATTEPTEEPTETPTPTATPSCEGPDTKLNLDGTEQASLLPDCGAPVVTREEQQKSGLGLGCGGSYPVILYKTTTSDSKTSICGTDASGENFRMVTKPDGGSALDMAGSYDPERDAFVAKKDGTTYSVLAYNGSLVVTKNGKSTTQDSDDDWISLDNEDDFD